MSFEFNPAEEDPHGECRHKIERLTAENKRLRMQYAVLDAAREDDRKALAAFKEWDNDSDLWAELKDQRDRIAARNAEMRRILVAVRGFLDPKSPRQMRASEAIHAILYGEGP